MDPPDVAYNKYIAPARFLALWGQLRLRSYWSWHTCSRYLVGVLLNQAFGAVVQGNDALSRHAEIMKLTNYLILLAMSAPPLYLVWLRVKLAVCWVLAVVELG